MREVVCLCRDLSLRCDAYLTLVRRSHVFLVATIGLELVDFVRVIGITLDLSLD